MSHAATHSQLIVPRYQEARGGEVWLSVGIGLLVIASLTLAGQSQLLRVAIPVSGALVGLVLYFRRPVLYIQYSLWLWFFSPLIRRLVDWRFGWMDPNFVLLTPLLVSGVAGLTLLRRRTTDATIPPPFILCGVAILYGFVVGMVLRPSAETVYGLLNWMCPLLFGLNLYRNWPLYRQQKEAISKTFLWALLILGTYGIFQFLMPPAWDCYWLQNVRRGLLNPSFGLPEPLLVRVWSTMNAPGPFANTLMVGLLLLFRVRSSLKVPAAFVGYLSFLLTMVRTAWLTWFVGILWIVRSAKPKVVVRILLGVGTLLVCMLPVMNDTRMGPVIEERVKTFIDMGHDESFGARSDMYQRLIVEVVGKPFGDGLKNQEVSEGIVVDSGFLTIFFSLGWLGAVLFCSGVILLFKREERSREDAESSVDKGVVIAILAQLVGGNIFVNVTGLIFWIFASLLLAADSTRRLEKYASTQIACVGQT